MGLFHLAKNFAMTIRESANDGSDFSNPDADYRVLFLGEDGNLYNRDSAGTVTAMTGSSGSVATDAIWDAAGDLAVGTGANTAARLAKGGAGATLGVYDATVQWLSGTSFPASPDSGDRYFRTDVRAGMWFRFDGTQWRSENRFTIDIDAQGLTADLFNQYVAVPADFPIYISQWHIHALVTGSATWVVNLMTVDFDSATASLDTQSTASQTANKNYHYTKSINQVVDTDNANSAGNITGLIVQWDEQSGTATFYGGVLIEYQLITT